MSHKHNISDTKLPDIVDTIKVTPELRKLSSYITHYMQHASGADDLIDELKGTGQFTVFAPNDAAFEKSKDKLAKLMKSEKVEELKKLLGRHVVKQELNKQELIKKGTEKFDTFGGEQISVVNDADVRIESSAGKAKVIKPDIMAGNGVIHILDSVL